MILIPPSIGLRGNIYASLGSRLSTYLHTGKIEPKFEFNPKIAENVYSSTFLLLVLSIFNGFVAAEIASLIGIHEFSFDLVLNLILISAIAAFLSAIFMVPATLALAIGSYMWGWDPDNLTAPLITLIGDIVSLPLIFASVDVVFAMNTAVKISFVLIIVAITLMLYRLSKGEVGWRIVKESTPILMACALMNFGAGTILGHEVESLIAIAGILTIIPAFLEDGGAMGGILAARFSSMLHLGALEPKPFPEREVLRSFAVMHFIGLIVFTLVGVFGQIVNYTLSIPTVPTLYMVASTVVAGQILIAILNFMAYYFSILSFKKGLDPDNVGIPLITSVMDVLGSGCLILSLKVFGVI